jgi:hypothetical protein
MPAPFIPCDDGRWVNADFERLARNIKEYNPELELRWIPPENRTREDKAPYVVVHSPVGGQESVVLHATELDSPVEILTRLYLADSKNGDVLERLEAHNLAVENLRMQEYRDEMDELADQALFLLSSPLNTVKFKGKKLDHLRRPVL